jgi:hypothetical protein
MVRKLAVLPSRTNQVLYSLNTLHCVVITSSPVMYSDVMFPLITDRDASTCGNPDVSNELAQKDRQGPVAFLHGVRGSGHGGAASGRSRVPHR